MPITKSAKKALRQSKKRRKLNLWHKAKIKKAWQSGNLSSIYKALDKAVKKNVIKPGKAARKKSQAARLYSSLTKDQELGVQSK